MCFIPKYKNLTFYRPARLTRRSCHHDLLPSTVRQGNDWHGKCGSGQTSRSNCSARESGTAIDATVCSWTLRYHCKRQGAMTRRNCRAADWAKSWRDLPEREMSVLG